MCLMFCDCILRRPSIVEATWYLRQYEPKVPFLSCSCCIAASCQVLKAEFDLCFVCMYRAIVTDQAGENQGTSLYIVLVSFRGMWWWGFPGRLAWLNSCGLAHDLVQVITSPFWKGTLSLKTDDFWILAIITSFWYLTGRRYYCYC